MSHVFGCKQTPDTPPTTTDEESSGNTSDGDAKKKKGNRAMGKAKYPKAIKYYTKAMRADPSNPTYVLNRAIANAALELWKDAETDAEQAVGLGSPPSAKGFFQLARARLKRGHCDKAMSAVEAGLKQHPGEPALVKLKQEIERDMAAREAKRAKEAELEAKQRNGPSGLRSVLELARTASNEGRLEEAAKLLTEARAESAPVEEATKREHIAVLSLLAKVRMQARQWQEAVAVSKDLVKMEEEVYSMERLEEREALSNAFNNLGIALKNAGQLGESVDALNSAYNRSTNGDDKVATPQSAQILQNIGQTLRTMKKPEEARKFFSRALEIGQRLFSVDHGSQALNYIGIARCCREAGHVKESIESFTRALEIFMAKSTKELLKDIPEVPSEDRLQALQQQCRGELAQLLAAVEQVQAAQSQAGPSGGRDERDRPAAAG